MYMCIVQWSSLRKKYRVTIWAENVSKSHTSRSQNHYALLLNHRRRQGGRGGANDPLWKKIFEIDREIPLTRISGIWNLEFLTKQPPLCKNDPPLQILATPMLNN
jgi:hypothetical protein